MTKIFNLFFSGHYESHHPPDILEHPNVGADRNLFIQTGELNSQHEQERVPVAGGNENFMPGTGSSMQTGSGMPSGNGMPVGSGMPTGSGNNENLSNQVNDLPMHRLVLGESDPNPRFITGSNSTGSGNNPTGSGNILPEPEMRSEQRSEAIGSEDQIINQGPPQPTLPVHTGSGNVVSEVAERSETVGSASFSVPPPPSTSAASLFPSIMPQINQRRSITPDEQRSEAAGSATFSDLSGPPPPPMTFAAPSTVSGLLLPKLF